MTSAGHEPVTPATPATRREWHWDIVAAATLAVITSACVYMRLRRTFPTPQTLWMYDWWFQADFPRTIDMLTDRHGDHHRTTVHPLFSLLGYGSVSVARLLRHWPDGAVQLVLAVWAGSWSGAVYTLARVLGHARRSAILVWWLCVSSAAFLYWSAVPETYTIGSLTILIPLILVALPRAGQLGWLAAITTALSASVTITNAMSGAIHLFARFRPGRALVLGLTAWGLVAGAWIVQKQTFETASFPLSDREELHYLRPAPSPVEFAREFLFGPQVAPPTHVIPSEGITFTPVLLASDFRRRWHRDGTHWWILTGVWFALVVAGFFGALVPRQQARRYVPLLLVIAGQATLHFLYGEERFLYVLDWAPLLVIIACSWLPLVRSLWADGAVAAFGLALFIANTGAMTADWKRMNGGDRIAIGQPVEAALLVGWSGHGHVPIGPSFSSDTSLAYHEPGGWLSPEVGSFGIGVAAPATTPSMLPFRVTQDTAQLQQSPLFDAEGAVQGVATTTSAYTTTWLRIASGLWRATISVPLTAPRNMQLVVSSVGPTGGPIWTTEVLTPGTLRINGRWSVTVDGATAPACLSDTLPRGLTSCTAGVREWHDGLAVVAYPLIAGSQIVVNVADDRIIPPTTVAAAIVADSVPLPASLYLDVPDRAFVDAAYMQRAQLMVALRSNGARPGDPWTYPYPWHRDAAFIVTALAQAGEIGAARSALTPMLHTDFEGGFGSEIDHLGLSIWAADEVARRVDDRAYDRELWPDIVRKADMLVVAVAGTGTVKAKVVRAEIGRDLRIATASQRPPDHLSEAAIPHAGHLVDGIMDGLRPRLYLTATAFMGLRRSADIADRLHDAGRAAAWRRAAVDAQVAWQSALATGTDTDQRTVSTSLWPTEIGANDSLAVAQLLERAWQSHADASTAFVNTPQWTYFDLAEAHEDLVAGRPDRSWQIMRWFFANQESPGLYTWWEGAENTDRYGRWPRIWTGAPPARTSPHYWTAAEMLSLQLEMLTRASCVSGTCSIRLGDGVPAEWRAQTLTVCGVSTIVGTVSWKWDRGALDVSVKNGPDVPIIVAPMLTGRAPARIARGSQTPAWCSTPTTAVKQ